MLPVVGGTYEVVEKLREGGMGAVYRVRHLLLDEPRVIKVMRASVEEDLHARERFLREAQMARRLSHPNVAVLHDLAEARPGTFYMVMELIDGPSLWDVLGTGRLLPVSVLLDLGAQALDGLEYLHERGIVHRDVSPENLMVADVFAGRPTVKIIDLGVAKRADEEGLTTTGIFVGKLRYASPEQLGALKKGESIDGRSDVYSLGCVLYHLLTGSPAYLAETPQAWIRQHVLERPRPFATTDRTFRVPEPVRHAVLKALRKERDARFGSAAQFASALRELGASLSREAGEEGARRDLADARAVLAAARQAGAGKCLPATVEDLVASGLLPSPREAGAPDVPGPAAEEATVRLSSSSRAAARPGGETGSRRIRAGIALAASAAVLTGAAAIWYSVRSPSPRPPLGPASTGVLVLNASPWGRVVSLVEETSGASHDAGAAVTPCRIALPAGRWRVVVRGADGTEASATVVVSEGSPSPLHLDLPGFDVETAVRSFVPDGT